MIPDFPFNRTAVLALLDQAVRDQAVRQFVMAMNVYSTGKGASHLAALSVDDHIDISNPCVPLPSRITIDFPLYTDPRTIPCNRQADNLHGLRERMVIGSHPCG